MLAQDCEQPAVGPTAEPAGESADESAGESADGPSRCTAAHDRPSCWQLPSEYGASELRATTAAATLPAKHAAAAAATDGGRAEVCWALPSCKCARGI